MKAAGEHTNLENTSRINPRLARLSAVLCVVFEIAYGYFWLKIPDFYTGLLQVFIMLVVPLFLYAVLTSNPKYVHLDGERLIAQYMQFGVVTQTFSVRASEVSELLLTRVPESRSVQGTFSLKTLLRNGRKVDFRIVDGRIASAIMENPSFRELVRQGRAGNGSGGADR
jgi:hypothetical protein